MSAHEPIRYDFEPGYCGELVASSGSTLATFSDEPSPEDARRLVACWNACEGIRTEALEHRTHLLKAEDTQLAMLQAQRDELLAALCEATRCLSWHTERHGVGMDALAVQIAIDAIAKVRAA